MSACNRLGNNGTREQMALGTEETPHLRWPDPLLGSTEVWCKHRCGYLDLHQQLATLNTC